MDYRLGPPHLGRGRSAPKAWALQLSGLWASCLWLRAEFLPSLASHWLCQGQETQHGSGRGTNLDWQPSHKSSSEILGLLPGTCAERPPPAYLYLHRGMAGMQVQG